MLCLATPTHSFKRVKITHICSIWAQIFAKLDTYFIPNMHNSVLVSITMKQIKNDNSCDQLGPYSRTSYDIS